MRTKSRFSFAGLVVPFTMAFVFIMAGMLYLWIASSDVSSGSSNFSLYITACIVMPIMIAGLLFGILRYVNRVEIDDAGITYTNVLSRRVERYLFSELDGYTIRTMHSKGVEYNILYPVKKGKKLKGISSVYYSNYEELKAALPQKMG